MKLEHFINTINNSIQSITISLKNGLYKFQEKNLGDSNIVVTNNSITLNNLFIASPDSYFNFSSDGTEIRSLTNLGSSQSTFVIPKKISTLSEMLFFRNLNIQYIDMSFSNITVLSKYEVNSGMSSAMFEYCENLKKVKLPLKLTTIGSYAFNTCKSLTKIDFPPKLTKIHNFAFSSTGLEEIFIPKTLKEIGADFQKNYFCTKVTIEEGCTITIQGLTFSNNSMLETVIIPDSITFINSSAFRNSPNVKLYVSSIEMKNKLLSWNIDAVTEDRIIVQNN
ncbi:MAG: leucine-rich repeat domain-containing protein [Ureaplasma sp.]|nr:leucine-rich repeat domain-containing protein [Ureaplasma sp.]